MFENEMWKDVVGGEGIYQMSNYGRVKSLERYVVGKGGKERLLKEKYLKELEVIVCGKSYNKFTMKINGVNIKIYKKPLYEKMWGE